jgi:hypothetical protein
MTSLWPLDIAPCIQCSPFGPKNSKSLVAISAGVGLSIVEFFKVIPVIAAQFSQTVYVDFDVDYMHVFFHGV